MAKKPGKFYIRRAEDEGFKVTYGKGDHVKVKAKDGSSISIPYNLKGNGTEYAIRKWLLQRGVELGIIICICVLTYVCIALYLA